MTIITTVMHPGGTVNHLGYTLAWLDKNDPDGAVAQLHKHYSHGGGWNKFDGFTLMPDKSIKYTGDPKLPVRAEITFRDEKIYVYDHAWFLVLQPDGTYEIARMD